MDFVMLTPAKQVMACQAASVTVDGAAGQFGVLPGHMPLVSLMAPGGRITVEKATGDVETFAVTDGVVDVTPETVTVLAEALLADEA